MANTLDSNHNPFNTKTVITTSNDPNYKWVYKTYYDVGTATLPLTNLDIKNNKLYYFLIGQGGCGTDGNKRGYCGTEAPLDQGLFVGTNFNLTISLGDISKNVSPSITGTYVDLSNNTLNIDKKKTNGTTSSERFNTDLRLVTFYDGLTNKTTNNTNYDGKYIGGNGGLGGGSISNVDGLSSGAGGGGGQGVGTKNSGGIGINGYSGGNSFGKSHYNGGNGGRGFNFDNGGVGGGGGGGGHGDKSEGDGAVGGLGAIMIYYQLRI